MCVKKIKEAQNNQRGITLIALVVTVIILLILAGVTISMLVGDNGIIKRAAEAAEATEYASIKEEIVTTWYEVLIDATTENLTAEETAELLEEKLQEYDTSASVEYVEGNNTYEITYKDYMFEIQEDEGTLTTDRQDIIDEVDDIWSNLEDGLTDEAKAEKLQEELSTSDPYAEVEYDDETGKIIVDYEGYTFEVDPDTGEVGEFAASETAEVEITSTPSSTTVIEGEEATFTVEVEGTGEITYQWYYKETRTGEGTEIDGATESTYTISSVTTADDGYYYVEVTSTYKGETKTETSSLAKLTVQTIDPASITAEPSSTSTIEGESASLTVTAEGTGVLTYQWYKTSVDGDTENGTKIEGATSSTYEITNASSADDGYYYCVITQTVGSSETTTTTTTAKVTVDTKAEISANLTDTGAIEGESVTFSVEVDAEDESQISYQWYKTNIDGDTENGTKIEGATSNTYEITNASSADDGFYYCVITQTSGDSQINLTTTTAELTVVEQVEITAAPSSSSTIAGAEDVIFSTNVSGAEGEISYQWYYIPAGENEPVEITGADTSEYKILADDVTESLNGNSYYCVITQNYGDSTITVETEKATLTVAEQAKITTNITDTNVIAGEEDITFTVEAEGTGNITYQWYYKTTANGEGTLIQDATSNSYTIAAADQTDAIDGRYYYCEVTQTYGTGSTTVESDSALLTLGSPVTITANPVSKTVGAGNDATFTVEVTGDGTFTYQWYSNTTDSNTGGEKIDGETSSTYEINSVTDALSGTYYYVEVTQTYEGQTKTIASSVAELTVSNFTASPNPVTVYVGGKNTVSLSGTNVGTFSIKTEPTSTTATATLTGNTITVTGVEAGTTSLVVTETSGGKEVEIEITVIEQPSLTISGNTNNYVGNETIFTAIPDVGGTYDSVTYQWYYNSTGAAGSGEASESKTDTSYTFSVNTAGTYYVSCVATYLSGTATTQVTSEAKEITIVSKPTIAISPTTATIATINNGNIEVEITGTFEKATYKWYYNTSNTAGKGTLGQTTTDSTLNTDEYQFSSNTAGTYYVSCVATLTYGGETTVTSTTATITVIKANYSITSGQKTTYYTTLALAIAGAEENDTIETLQNVTDSSTATVSKNLTLDTASYTITRSATTTVSSGSTLNLTGSGKITSSSATTITNNGTLTLDEGVAVANTNSSYYGVNNTGTVTIEDGEVSTSGYGIYNTGTANLNDGVVTSTGSSKYGVYNYQNGAVNIEGATVSSTSSYGIFNYSTSESYTPTVTMSSGTVSGTYGIYNSGNASTYSAVAKITGGTVTGSTYGIYNLSVASVLEIGDSEADVSTNTPLIQGGTYGIYCYDRSNDAATWTFYNGIVEGTILGYYGFPLTTRNSYGVVVGTDNTYNTAYLTELASTADASTVASNAGYIGKTVNYTVSDSATQTSLTDDNITWQILYSDGENIYLWASDYIAQSIMPEKSEKSAIPDSSSYTHSGYFSNVYSQYSGYDGVTTGSGYISPTIMEKMNPAYVAEGFTSTYSNMKSVAYMLDTDIWNTFVGTGAEYATGGTSVEILLNSYSQKFGVNYSGVAYSKTGYYVSNGTITSYYLASPISAGHNYYCLSNSYSKASAAWLASPASDDGDVILVHSLGNVNGYDYYITYGGFRPQVSLSSGVSLIEQSDGTYSISE